MRKLVRATTATVRNNRFQSHSLLQNQNNSSTNIHSKKDKQLNEYLTPRHQSYSAQGTRSQDKDHIKNKFNAQSQNIKIQMKLQPKTPIMMTNSNNKQEQLKNKMNKLGLQSFMKQIVLSDKLNDPLFSSRVIHALNKTYIQNDVKITKYQFKPTLGKRSLRESRRVQNIANGNMQVQWNPQINQIQHQFKQLDTYIPNAMFPCRRDQTTKLLKNRYKKREILKEKSEKEKQKERENRKHDSSLSLAKYDRNSVSMNLNHTNRNNNNNNLLRFNSFEKKVPNSYMGIGFSSPSHHHNSNSNNNHIINLIKNSNTKIKQQCQQSLINCRRVKIYV